MESSVQRGYNIDLNCPVQGFTKLHRASWLGYLDEVRTSLKTIPTNSKDANMRTPLHLAAAAGNTLIVRMLMESDLNFNDTDVYGKTAIMKAIEGSHKETVKAMIARGADLTAADRNGNNAMHMAIIGGHYDIAHLMLQYFPNCNVGNIDGVTPFHMLAEGIQVKLARKFIDYGASIGSLDNRGRTPLMLACKRGSFPMVSLLLKHGANPQARDNDGWAPLDYASIMGHIQIKNLLEKYISGEIKVDKEKEYESSSSDEEEEEKTGIQCFVDKSSQRIVPIRIESQSMFLKRQRQLLLRREMEAIKDAERKQEGVRKADGTLLPMPDVVEAMQLQANKLGDIREWLLKHEERLEDKRKDYKQLKDQAKKLWDQRQKLLEKLEEQKKKAAELSQRSEKALNIKEAEFLREQIDILREKLGELREQHDRTVAERDELQLILEKGSEIHKTSGFSIQAKVTQLLKENEVLYSTLQQIQDQTRDITNDLTNKCNVADSLANHLKTLLRGTYKLLEEKHGEMNKVMKEVDYHQEAIDRTKDSFDTIMAENQKVGASITGVDFRMYRVKRYLAKVHKEMEKHPFTKGLIDAGILDEKKKPEKVKDSTVKKTKKKPKTDHNELEAEPEVKALAIQSFDPAKAMSSTSNAPTVCQSTLETVKYSWLGEDIENTFEINENDLQLLLDKAILDTEDSSSRNSNELIRDKRKLSDEAKARYSLIAERQSK